MTELQFTAPRHAMLRLPFVSLGEDSRVKDPRTYGLRIRGGRLEPAEGSRQYGSPKAYSAIHEADGTLYGWAGSAVYRVYSGTLVSGLTSLLDVAAYFPETGDTKCYGAAYDGIFRIEGSRATSVSPLVGEYLVSHRDRLFLADGNTLHYSAPLEPEQWDEMADGAGKVELPPAEGRIAGMCSFGGKLYLFLRTHIYVLRADARDLNFALERVEFDEGEILARSPKVCGKYLVFLTEHGICTFDGRSWKRIRTPLDHVFDNGNGIAEAACHKGEYFVACKRGEERYLYIYDPERDGVRYLAAEAVGVTGGEQGIWYRTEEGVMALGEPALPVRGDFLIEFKLQLRGTDGTFRKRRRIDGIRMVGAGTYDILFKTARGDLRIFADGDTFYRMPRTLTGEISCSISFKALTALPEAVELYLREDPNDD